MSWTPERVDQMKRLWAEGLSCSQIARVLGGVSRNAVIGKAHRIGLAGRDAPRKTIKPAPKLRKVDPPPPPPAEATVPDVPPSERIKLLDLKHDHCRYPIGDPLEPEFGFCGKKRDGSPYCPGHHALCSDGGAIKATRAYHKKRASESAEPDVVEQMGDAA